MASSHDLVSQSCQVSCRVKLFVCLFVSQEKKVFQERKGKRRDKNNTKCVKDVLSLCKLNETQLQINQSIFVHKFHIWHVWGA